MDYFFALERDDIYAFVCGIALGLLVGITVCFLVGLAIPDSKASLWGAAVGAVGAVSGAFALWRVQERRAARSAAAAVAHIVHRVFDWFDEIDKIDRVANEEMFLVGTEALKKVVRTAQENLRRFDSRWQVLSSNQIAEFLNIEATLGAILRCPGIMLGGVTPEQGNTLAQQGLRMRTDYAGILKAEVIRLLSA